ncbi:MAG: hypothetical protein HY976_00025 [Candidatus Kerfeldbacteria bacterium]|nr:hypothetical protein [Candidatus Kerfeldbacteria bacterium]
MKMNNALKTTWSRWLPMIAIVVVLIGGVWQLVLAVGQIFDGPLTQDSIVAQEERLNQKAFTDFEAWTEQAESLSPIPDDLNDPFRP